MGVRHLLAVARGPGRRPPSMAPHVEPQPSTSTSASSRRRAPRPAGCRSAMPATFAARSVTMRSWFSGCSRCCPSRLPSRGRRCGASARACPAPPTGERACRDRAGTARRPRCRRRRRGSARSANGTEMSGSVRQVGEPPRLGAVRQVAVGEQDHRRAVLDRDAGRFDRREEAVRRAHRRDDRERRLAVTAVHRHAAGRRPRSWWAGRSTGRPSGCRSRAAAARGSRRGRSSLT